MLQLWRRRKKRYADIEADEILLDSSNVPEFDVDQFEGRIERPLKRRTLSFAGGVIALMFLLLLGRAADLQILQGTALAQTAKNNQLSHTTVFADRGIVVDRNNVPLAWNERSSVTDEYARRTYADMQGLAHIVGYVKEPAKDSKGFYYRSEFEGQDGVERAYNTELGGKNGIKLTETDARGAVVAQVTLEPPQAGQKLVLSIDAAVTEGLYKAIEERVKASGFQGGAGVVMDVRTGELLAITSYPEYSQTALMAGDSAAIKLLNADKRQPFLNRATDGLYSPGSIVKPIVAVAALTEGVITPEKQILSTGSISIPNAYDPKNPTIFKDWKAHGWVDMRRAIAVSSDVYFYEVGGGFQGQKGLGIDLLDKYFRLFGFGQDAGLAGFSEKLGNIPSPAWKETTFNGDPWRIGNTYHTAIGQYGMQVTPLQAVRATAVLADGGGLLVPHVLVSEVVQSTNLGLSVLGLRVAQEGMRQSVTEGIAQAVNFGFVHVAAKTGTAQVGIKNEYINSWMIGFWPYEKPRYAYAVVLERGPAHTTVGAPAATSAFIQWLNQNAPQYLSVD